MPTDFIPPGFEPFIRSLSSAVLYINGDNSWSVGPDEKNLVKVKFGTFSSLTDSTFNFSAVDAEKIAGGGYRLFVQSDTDPNTIVEADVDATGTVTRVTALSTDQMFAAETQYSVDLNDNGGFGAAPAPLQGGKVNLYVSGTGAYQLGTASANAQNITLGGVALTLKLLPQGWSITHADPSVTGYDVYVKDANGATFLANLNSQAAYVGGGYLTGDQLATREKTTGTDLNGDLNVSVDTGWTGTLQNSYIKAAVDSAIASTGKMTYTQVVSLANTIIQTHVANANAPISASELADLQAIAGRGKNLFVSASADSGSTDYLANVFAKMVTGSVANDFYTGGQTTSVPLGNLVANSPLATFQQLVNKWLLGGDNPTPAAGGDAATGKANDTVGVYAQSRGTLFVNGTTPGDIKQGAVGDCYMATSLLSVANSNPGAIASMIVDNGISNGTHTWGIRFFDSSGSANWITVNDLLPVTAAGSTNLIYGGNPGGDLNGEIWFPLIEKAYAEANTLRILPRAEQSGLDAYWAIEGGGPDPLTSITGKKVTMYVLVDPATNPQLVNAPPSTTDPYINYQYVDKTNATQVAAYESAVLAAVSANKPIWVGSDLNTTDAYGNQLLVSGHALSLLPVGQGAPATAAAYIYNPWGVNLLPTPPGNVGFLSPFPESTSDLVKLLGTPGLDFAIG
jgi:hypothetical protein